MMSYLALIVVPLNDEWNGRSLSALISIPITMQKIILPMLCSILRLVTGVIRSSMNAMSADAIGVASAPRIMNL